MGLLNQLPFFVFGAFSLELMFFLFYIKATPPSPANIPCDSAPETTIPGGVGSLCLDAFHVSVLGSAKNLFLELPQLFHCICVCVLTQIQWGPEDLLLRPCCVFDVLRLGEVMWLCYKT